MKNTNDSSEKNKKSGKWIVYMHINKFNNKMYVGITSRTPEVRYKRNGYGYKSSPYFYSAIQKYGWDNFEHNILFTDLCESEAKAKEKELIKLYKTNNRDFGYNCTEGGDGVCGRKPTPEQIEKIRASLKGRKHTEAWKRHMSNIMKNRVMSDAWKKKISESHMGELNPSARKIVLINSKYELIKVYECMKYASNELNVHISHIQNVCEKKYSNTGGYVFMYYEDYINSKDDLLKREPLKIRPYKRRVLQYDLSNNFINEYESIREATRKTGISGDAISKHLSGVLKTGGGYIWKYAN